MPPPNPHSREQAYLTALQSQPKDVNPDTIYEKLEIAGKGAYGAVYKGRHVASGHVVALKIINLDTEDDDVDDIQKEISLLQQLMLGSASAGGAPQNVTKYYGSMMEGPRVWIVMEYAEGGSIRTLSRAQPLKELHICLIMREVLIALAFLHKNGVIHRDIKAANILLTTQPLRILLCDFGVAALLQSNTSKRSTFVGTPYWMAPEVVTEGKMYDSKADIWSLGITLLEMAYGEPPMSGQPAARAVMLLGDKRMRAPRLEGDHWSKEMRDFVVGCLNEDAADRLSAEELSKSRWIKQQAKTPLTQLNDLIARFQAWKDSGGQRMSLAAGVGASIDDDEYDEMPNGDWAFDTVRSRASMMLLDQKAQAGEVDKSLSPPTARPAPQSLRRLFHDETSSDPDPFQSFAHQQPPTPQSSEDNGTVKQTGRFASPEADDPSSREGSPPKNEFDGQTIRQARLGRDGRSPTPLMIKTDQVPSINLPLPSADSNATSATYHPDELEPTPIAPRGDGPVPSPRPIRNKMSLDNLPSAASFNSQPPTSKSSMQLGLEDRSKSSLGMSRPGGGEPRDGLRGFQFPLMGQSGPPPAGVSKLQPPHLGRNHSAAPAFPSALHGDTSQSTLPSASPTAPSFPGLSPRPPMMRQASLAVMENRSAAQSHAQAAQAQALALAHGHEGGAGPHKGLAVPGGMAGIGLGRPGQQGTSQGMARTRSGSRADDGHNVGLRDLLKLTPAAPGMQDLLPPSPSVSTTPHKPSPRPQQTHNQPGSIPAYPAFPGAVSSASLPMSKTPSLASLASTVPASAPAPNLGPVSTSTGLQNDWGPIPNVRLGPPIRPLDLGHLDSQDVFTELESLVDDMQSWLGCVENGLEDLLRLPESANA
ncbi:hypothetical protein B9479_001841 [Cryptococcus floricola]|uniref:Protein kinase domain-containing protein n=1 Tax=Cryptococcus floricola TaxID=2591691 RepID=A0A5D3B5S6_9TREE|nr:hypothetical protein B9479_001841 [Cryptococcus floricola]